MSSFAQLSTKERNLFFQQYQASYGVDRIIVEKDFWVCWLLGILYRTEPFSKTLIFKGGTSLSKVFQAIQRFSEDIDLSVDPGLLGWSEEELTNAPSRTKRDRHIKDLEEACARIVQESFLPLLEAAISDRIGAAPDNRSWLEYQRDPLTNSPIILFLYPTDHGTGGGYIPSQVKLEFGSLTDQRPTGTYPVTAMVDILAPARYGDCQAAVVALELERTFWEKATILHAEYHRPEGRTRDRFSRHYADFAALWRHPGGQAAATRWDLLERVRRHKNLFFGSAWANYEAAERGTLKLVPKPEQISALRNDYREMRQMFFTEPPSFENILETLHEAEQTLKKG